MIEGRNRETRQDSVFITKKGQFVFQTADKKLITASSTIEYPFLSLYVRAPIWEILEHLHSEHWCKDQNMSFITKYVVGIKQIGFQAIKFIQFHSSHLQPYTHTHSWMNNY